MARWLLSIIHGEAGRTLYRARGIYRGHGRGTKEGEREGEGGYMYFCAGYAHPHRHIETQHEREREVSYRYFCFTFVLATAKKEQQCTARSARRSSTNNASAFREREMNENLEPNPEASEMCLKKAMAAHSISFF